ncbi:unnamed protein product [Symbiodinium sp. KB8]|nr:unnamed protein product [Symbiodinium sp. KB8]
MGTTCCGKTWPETYSTVVAEPPVVDADLEGIEPTTCLPRRWQVRPQAAGLEPSARADGGGSQGDALPRWLLDFSCGVPEEVQEIMRTKDGKLTLFDVSGPPVRLLWMGAVCGLTFAISIPWPLSCFRVEGAGFVDW